MSHNSTHLQLQITLWSKERGQANTAVQSSSLSLTRYVFHNIWVQIMSLKSIKT